MDEKDFLDEDELLLDVVLDQLGEELPEGCMYCGVRSGADLFFGELE